MALLFGTPVTRSTLEGMVQYSNPELRPITQAEMAHVVMQLMQAEGKQAAAVRCVDNLKQRYGRGVTNRVIVYNATGGDLRYATDHNYSGHCGEAPYPAVIQNGQWAAFLHVHTSGTACGSSASAVYHGTYANNEARDFLVCFDSPWDTRLYRNKVYAEVREAGHWEGCNRCWLTNTIKRLKNEKNSMHWRDDWGGCTAEIGTGQNTSPLVEAILIIHH